MLHSSSKAINISVHITILKNLNLNLVLIRCFEHWATSIDNQNTARAVPVDLTKLTDSLLHNLHVSIYLYPKRSNIFPWTLKKLGFPLYGWNLSFKATGLLETSSLLLINNFQGILITYFMGFSSFNGWVSYRPNWRVMVNPFTWSTWKVPIMDIKS